MSFGRRCSRSCSAPRSCRCELCCVDVAGSGRQSRPLSATQAHPTRGWDGGVRRPSRFPGLPYLRACDALNCMLSFARFEALSVPFTDDFVIAKRSVACATASDIWSSDTVLRFVMVAALVIAGVVGSSDGPPAPGPDTPVDGGVGSLCLHSFASCRRGQAHLVAGLAPHGSASPQPRARSARAPRECLAGGWGGRRGNLSVDPRKTLCPPGFTGVRADPPAAAPAACSYPYHRASELPSRGLTPRGIFRLDSGPSAAVGPAIRCLVVRP